MNDDSNPKPLPPETPPMIVEFVACKLIHSGPKWMYEHALGRVALTGAGSDLREAAESALKPHRLWQMPKVERVLEIDHPRNRGVVNRDTSLWCRTYHVGGRVETIYLEVEIGYRHLLDALRRT